MSTVGPIRVDTPSPAVIVSYNPHQQPSLTQTGLATADVYVELRPSG